MKIGVWLLIIILVVVLVIVFILFSYANQASGDEKKETSENHNIGLKIDYDGFGNAIKINDPENNPIEEEAPALNCGEDYDVGILTENLGDYAEDVEINMRITSLDTEEVVFEEKKIKEVLGVGDSTTTGRKNNFDFNLESGEYTIEFEISIDGYEDIDDDDNFAQRFIEVDCEV